MIFLQNNPAEWTVTRLSKLASRQLVEVTRTVIKSLASQRLLLGRCLLTLDRNQVAWRLGYSGAVHFATRHGLDEREAREARRVARCLEDLPLLREAAEKGEVAWASLREIVRKATAATEARWLELASAWSPKVIERLVGQTAEGAEPCSPETLPDTPDKVHLHFIVDPEIAELYQRVVRELSLEAGRPLPAVDIFAVLCMDRLGKTPAERTRASAEARKDAAARNEAEARSMRRQGNDTVAWSEESERPARVTSEPGPAAADTHPASPASRPERLPDTDATRPEPVAADTDPPSPAPRPERVAEADPPSPAPRPEPVAAETDHPSPSPRVADEEPLPTPFAALAARSERAASDTRVELLRAEKPDWSNPRLRFSAEARLPTPAQRREVLRRDAYCCANPGCPNRLWLDVHHVAFYCVGGVTLPGNLVVLCTRCHSNVHKGWLRVTGTAPDGLLWTDRQGNPL